MHLLKEITKAKEAHGQLIREELLQKLSNELDEKKKEDKFPFEGKWCTVDEITILQKELKRNDRIVFTELLSLYLFLGIIILALYLLMAEFLLP